LEDLNSRLEHFSKNGRDTTSDMVRLSLNKTENSSETPKFPQAAHNSIDTMARSSQTKASDSEKEKDSQNKLKTDVK